MLLHRASTVAALAVVVLVAPSDAATFTVDSILDASDNCKDLGNPTQCDTDQDGIGNHCDGDFNNDGLVSTSDYINDMIPDAIEGEDSGTGTDMNCDGTVDALDIDVYFMPLFEAN